MADGAVATFIGGDDYRRHYNQERPHGGISYRTPAQAYLEAQELESAPTPATLNT